MFPCEMARCIAGFQPEARKYGPVLAALAANIRCPVRPGLGSDRAAFSISEHLADISWLPPAPPVAAVVRPVAAEAAEVAPDGRPGAPAAGVAAGQRPEAAVGRQPEAAVAVVRLPEAVALALIPAE